MTEKPTNPPSREPWTWLAAVMLSRSSSERETTYEKLVSGDKNGRKYYRVLARCVDAWRDAYSYETVDCDLDLLFTKLSEMRNLGTGQLTFPGLKREDLDHFHTQLREYDEERNDRMPHLKGRVLSQRLLTFPFETPRLHVDLLHVKYRRHPTELNAEPRFRKNGIRHACVLPAVVEAGELIEIDVPGYTALPLHPLLKLERVFRAAHGEKAGGYMQALWLQADDLEAQRNYLIAASPDTALSVENVTFSSMSLLPEHEVVTIDLTKLPL